MILLKAEIVWSSPNLRVVKQTLGWDEEDIYRAKMAGLPTGPFKEQERYVVEAANCTDAMGVPVWREVKIP